MLRGFTIGDLDVHGAPVERTEVADALDHMINAFGDAPGFGFRAADDKQTGEFVGWFHFRPRADGTAAEPELGYRLRRSYWGRGLATEGARALIDKGFEELDIERVIAETMNVHRVSRRVMEKAGLRLVRSFRADWPVSIPGDEHGDDGAQQQIVAVGTTSVVDAGRSGYDGINAPPGRSESGPRSDHRSPTGGTTAPP